MAKIGFSGSATWAADGAELIKAGHAVTGATASEYSTDRLAADGATAARSVAAACKDAEIVITMLPAGKQVREVYLGREGVLAAASPGALLVDSSTIDVNSAREVAQAAAGKGLAMVDAPVSGGVPGAQAASLTFMVGGPDDAFARASRCWSRCRQDHHRRQRRQRPSREDLQQMNPRGVDDRGVGGVSLGDKPRPRRLKLFDIS
jgi:3-hydroxyisobutyrate dehydrogenase